MVMNSLPIVWRGYRFRDVVVAVTLIVMAATSRGL